MLISNRTLMKIAAIGGIITCSTGMLYQKKVKDRIRGTEYYREAFKSLRSHRGAIKFLGEPIKEGKLNISDQNNYCDKYKAHFEVPVKGPLQKGKLYFWAKRLREDDKWTVERVELELRNEPDKRLLIKDITFLD